MTPVAEPLPPTSADLRQARRLVALLVLAASTGYLCRVEVTVVAPRLMEEFRFSQAQMGQIFSAFLVGYTVLQAPSGWIADRVKTRPLFLSLTLGWVLDGRGDWAKQGNSRLDRSVSGHIARMRQINGAASRKGSPGAKVDDVPPLGAIRPRLKCVVTLSLGMLSPAVKAGGRAERCGESIGRNSKLTGKNSRQTAFHPGRCSS